MASLGAEWSDDGTATLTAEGPVGKAPNGRIEGVRPRDAMYFAVVLARNARAHGEPWPWRSATLDISEATAVEGLKVALGDRLPVPDELLLEPPAPVVEPVDLQELRETVDVVQARLRQALSELGRIEGVLDSL